MPNGDFVSNPQHSRQRQQQQQQQQQQLNRLSVASGSDDLDADSFAFATATPDSGAVVSLPAHGVRLSIPAGALLEREPREVFLAVLPGARDRPRLAPSQTLLSPVVLAGPPGLALAKPAAISFGHCADLRRGSWELGVYHCDSLPSSSPPSSSSDHASGGDDESPWVKLVTVGQESASSSSSAPILASLDLGSCHVLTDFLSRFCVVGQSASSPSSASSVHGIPEAGGGRRACKSLRLLLHGRSLSSSGMDFALLVQVAEDLQSSLAHARRVAEGQGFRPLPLPDAAAGATLPFHDDGDDLHLDLGDCGAGWSLRPKAQQTFPFDRVWSGAAAGAAEDGSAGAGGSGVTLLQSSYSLRHVDPTVSVFAFKLSAFQSGRPDSCLAFHVDLDASAVAAAAAAASTSSSSFGVAPISTG